MMNAPAMRKLVTLLPPPPLLFPLSSPLLPFGAPPLGGPPRSAAPICSLHGDPEALEAPPPPVEGGSRTRTRQPRGTGPAPPQAGRGACCRRRGARLLCRRGGGGRPTRVYASCPRVSRGARTMRDLHPVKRGARQNERDVMKWRTARGVVLRKTRHGHAPRTARRLSEARRSWHTRPREWVGVTWHGLGFSLVSLFAKNIVFFCSSGGGNTHSQIILASDAVLPGPREGRWIRRPRGRGGDGDGDLGVVQSCGRAIGRHQTRGQLARPHGPGVVRGLGTARAVSGDVQQ
jgi:hypothetical protein